MDMMLLDIFVGVNSYLPYIASVISRWACVLLVSRGYSGHLTKVLFIYTSSFYCYSLLMSNGLKCYSSLLINIGFWIKMLIGF